MTDTATYMIPSLQEIVHSQHIIIKYVREQREHEHNAYVFEPGGRIRTVNHWGWLRRKADELLHPMQGVAFSVHQWVYGEPIGHGTTVLRIDKFEPILIAYLRDGRCFADQWASAEVLYDSIGRWRNAQDLLIDWQYRDGFHNPPTCAIGGLDWHAINPLH